MWWLGWLRSTTATRRGFDTSTSWEQVHQLFFCPLHLQIYVSEVLSLVADTFCLLQPHTIRYHCPESICCLGSLACSTLSKADTKQPHVDTDTQTEASGWSCLTRNHNYAGMCLHNQPCLQTQKNTRGRESEGERKRGTKTEGGREREEREEFTLTMFYPLSVPLFESALFILFLGPGHFLCTCAARAAVVRVCVLLLCIWAVQAA